MTKQEGRRDAVLPHQEGLYSAFMPHPSLKLGADLKVVGFAFCDRPCLQGVMLAV